MENNFTHIVYIPFRGVGIDLRDDEWFEERRGIFNDYTLKSLRGQSNKNFELWLSFRPEDRNNPIVEKLKDDCKDFKYTFTYEGLMYHDDKFGGDLYQRAKNLARVVRYCWRNNEWKQLLPSGKSIIQDKNKTLLSRLGEVLPHFEINTPKVLLTRIDSDDMFHYKAIETIQKYSSDIYPVTVIPKGYIYSTEKNMIAEWNPDTNPPFHSFRMGKDVFTNPRKYHNFMSPYKSHEDATKVGHHQVIGERLFCVVVHKPQNHISTLWDHKFRGDVVSWTNIKHFGI